MNGLFQIADTDVCGGLLPLFKILRKGVLRIIWIGIPILLIVMGTVDLGKAVISSDDKEIKASTGRFVKRIVYAIVIFLMVTIVNLVMNIITDNAGKDSKGNSNVIETGEGSNNDWRACWREAGK